MILFWIAAVLFALVQSALAGESNEIQLTETNNGKTAVASLGKTIVIRLPGDRSTGYSWELTKLSGDAVKMTAKPQYVDGPKGSGRVGGAFIFRFQTVQPGKATIKAAFQKSSARPLHTYSVDILVKKS